MMMLMTTTNISEEWLPKYSYAKIVRYIKRCQIVFSIAVAVFMSFVPEIREKVQETPLRHIMVTMCFEVMMFAVVSWIFGMNRIPANYLSLIFLRFFVFFDSLHILKTNRVNKSCCGPAVQPQVQKESSHWFGFWTDKSPVKPSCCCGVEEAYPTVFAEKMIFAAMILTMTGLITIYSKIDVSRCEWLAIILITLGTSLSTLTLISSMAISIIGKEFHKSLCKSWTLFAFITSVFIFVYATQRLYKRVRGKMLSNDRYFRTQAELLIFAVNVCVVAYYIPVIHPGFSFYDVVASFPANLATTTPKVIRTILHSMREDLQLVAQKISDKLSS